MENQSNVAVMPVVGMVAPPNNVRYYRTRHLPSTRHTMEGLASAVGVTRQTISDIELKGTRPNVVIALRLAQQLEVTVEELFPLSSLLD